MNTTHKFTQEESQRLYFTSDTHFCHENVIKYCNRPFHNLDHMTEKLIVNWNSKVPPNAVVYHLGDFAFTSKIEIIKEIIDKLNGDIRLIFGNHDVQNRFERNVAKELFDGTYDRADLDVEDEEIDGGKQRIVLFHYPILSWNRMWRGSWHLHGHVHLGPYSNSLDKKAPMHPARLDIGVDNSNFTPLSYNDVKVKITRQHILKKEIDD